MAETAARISWSGVGLSVPWRICGPRPLRWAVRELLGKPSYAVGARELARWSAENDGAERGAELVEQLADDA
jgi:UDP:flavonoid glycosyltransferase YjiC (YdhE family)